MDKQILTFKELREAKGFTQESLARAVGLSRLAIARYESRQTEPKLGNFLKLARILEVSLARLALAMGYEAGEKKVQVREEKSAFTPAYNEASEIETMQVRNNYSEPTPAKKQPEGAMEHESEDKKVQVREEELAYAPVQNRSLEQELMPVCNGYSKHTPAKRRAKGKGTGFVEERLVKRGNKQYKQYWFHWQKSEPKKGRVFATSKYIPKRLVAKIIGKNNQKLPVREILRSLGVKKQF